MLAQGSIRERLVWSLGIVRGLEREQGVLERRQLPIDVVDDSRLPRARIIRCAGENAGGDRLDHFGFCFIEKEDCRPQILRLRGTWRRVLGGYRHCRWRAVAPAVAIAAPELLRNSRLET